MSENEEFSDNFTDAKSEFNVITSPFENFSIEGPANSIKSGVSDTTINSEDEDEFFDVLDDSQFLKDPESVDEYEIQNLKPLPALPRRRFNNRMTVLEFLQEEEEEEEDADIEEEDKNKNNSKAGNDKRETIYEFLKEYEEGADDEDEDEKGKEDQQEDHQEDQQEESESSLSRLQNELEHEETPLEKERNSIINLQSNYPLKQEGRRMNSILGKSNPLTSFFKSNFNDSSDSVSDSMISELTETLTNRTDLSETRFSRVPSMISQSTDYLKLAKRFKPVIVKTKSKQKSEFTSLFLIQELNRTNPSSSTNDLKRNSSVTSTVSSNSSQPATDPSKAIYSLTFSPDGHFLAAAGAEGIIKIWSLLQIIDPVTNSIPRVATIFENEPIQILKGHSAQILDCAWSLNNFLLTASMDKTVRLWHHSRPDALGIFQHLDYVTSVAFHPRDPRIFISGSLDCKLRLWSIQDRNIINWNELPPGNFITAVSFTRSGSSVIAGTSGGTALIFDTEGLRYSTQILVRSSRSTSVGKKITSITPVPGQFDNDERVIKVYIDIIISSNDSRIRMYSLRDKNVIYKYKGHENNTSQIGASLSTDADYLLSGSEDCRVYLWRTDGKFEKKGLFSSFRKDHICSYESFKAHSNPVTAAIIAPNCVTNLLQSLQLRPLNPLQSGEGKIIVTADLTGQIKVFENNSKLIEWVK